MPDVGEIPLWTFLLIALPIVSYLIFYFFWDYCPGRWLFFIKGRDGFCYAIWDGSEEDDESTRGAEGDAAGRKSTGGFRYWLLIFDDHYIDEDGNIDRGKNYRGIFGKGLYFIGILRVVEIMRNRWAEIKGGEYRERMVVERGFSVKQNPMAFKADILDADNFLFHLLGTLVWAIINPDKAKRLTQDVYDIVIDLLRGELIAWGKKQPIYRPTFSFKEDSDGDVGFDDVDDFVGGQDADIMVPASLVSEKEQFGQSPIDINQIKDRFIEHLNRKDGYRYHEYKIEKKEGGKGRGVFKKKKKTFYVVDEKETEGTFFDMVKNVYGIDISRLAIHSVEADAYFAEALSASVKAQLDGIAVLIEAYYRRRSELQDMRAAKQWGSTIDEIKGTFLGQVAQSFRKHGVPSFFNPSFLYPWASTVLPEGASQEDVSELVKELGRLAKEVREAADATKKGEQISSKPE